MTQIAMDVHKGTSTLVHRAPGMASPKKVKCLTTRSDFARVLGDIARPWMVAVESSRHSPAVCRWLRQLGVDDLRLVNAQRMSEYDVNAPKTDARDALKILQRMELNDLPECYLASDEVQDTRALSRGRQTLRSISTTLRNTIRALLNQLGLQCRFTDLLGKAAAAELAMLVEQLPPLMASMVQRLIVMLQHVELALKDTDAQIRRLAADDPACQALMELPGMGPIIAFGLVSEIGDIERFENPKKLVSYAGLAPRAKDSDDHQGLRRLPHRCNKRLRHWSVQAAQTATLSKYDSRAKRTYYRVRERHHPNVAKIAAARVIMHEVFYRWHQAIESLNAAA